MPGNLFRICPDDVTGSSDLSALISSPLQNTPKLFQSGKIKKMVSEWGGLGYHSYNGHWAKEYKVEDRKLCRVGLCSVRIQKKTLNLIQSAGEPAVSFWTSKYKEEGKEEFLLSLSNFSSSCCRRESSPSIICLWSQAQILALPITSSGLGQIS